MSSAIALIVLVATTTIASTASEPVVTLRQGTLVGRNIRTGNSMRYYHAFQGIPYAQPPVNELRFMPPRPHEGWRGVFNATDDSKKCPQKDAMFDKEPHGDEDCLVLNVYTPIRLDSEEKLPVMFWIHGGGFTSGSGSSDLYGPDYFMDNGVVLVTVNYRLGALGFLNLKEDLVSGNMGLKDIVMALRWVKENVRHFSGDENNVTVFGNNAGGVIVSLLTLSPLAKGLFSKAICQSGVAMQRRFFDFKERERAFTLAKVLRKDPSDSQELLKMFSKLTAFDFVKGTPRTFDSTETRDRQQNVLPFGPSVEVVDGNGTDIFLEMAPEEVYANGEIPNADIPMMIGFSSMEALVYLRNLLRHPETLDKINYNFQFSLPLRGLTFEYNSKKYHEAAENIRKFYFPHDGIINKKQMQRFIDYVSDEMFYPIAKTVEQNLAKFKAPIYYYKFSYDGDLNYYKRFALSDENVTSINTGATNGDELCYLFRCKALDSVYHDIHLKASEDFKCINRMTRLWTNFAKYGNPTPRHDDYSLHYLTWKPATLENMNILNIDIKLKMAENHRNESIAFWDNFYEKHSNASGPISTVHEEL